MRHLTRIDYGKRHFQPADAVIGAASLQKICENLLTASSLRGIMIPTYLNALMELFCLEAVFQRAVVWCETVSAQVRSLIPEQSRRNLSKRLRLVPLS